MEILLTVFSKRKHNTKRGYTMCKLLLGTTGLAAAATLTANAALADVSISGAYEFQYNSRSSNLAASDGTTFANDSEVTFKFFFNYIYK